jgi:hypothetical protein
MCTAATVYAALYCPQEKLSLTLILLLLLLLLLPCNTQTEEDAFSWLVPLRVLCKDHNLTAAQVSIVYTSYNIVLLELLLHNTRLWQDKL